MSRDEHKDVKMNRADHVETEAWLDYARGLESPEQRQRIEDHLASGCQSCTDMAKFMKKLSEAGLQFAGNAVPDEWSRRAEGILRQEVLRPIKMLPSRRAQPVPFRLSAEPVQLRAGSSPQRHMTFQASDCTVDLRVEAGSNPRKFSLVGQITDVRKENAAVSSAPVVVLFNNTLVASTSSNAFGEFQFALSRRRNMVLSFPFEGSRIDVMLDDLVQDS